MCVRAYWVSQQSATAPLREVLLVKLRRVLSSWSAAFVRHGLGSILDFVGCGTNITRNWSEKLGVARASPRCANIKAGAVAVAAGFCSILLNYTLSVQYYDLCYTSFFMCMTSIPNLI